MIRSSLSSLTFAGADWLWPALAAGAAGLLFVAWGYRHTVGHRQARMIGAALKTLAVVALVLCAIEPTWSGQRVKPGANIIAVVADNSVSMNLQGEGEVRPRGEEMRELFTGKNAGWRSKVENLFDAKRYLAGSNLQATADFADLRFDARASGLGAALETLRERFRGQPFAGIVLLTDGVATDLADLSAATAGLPPIYPVLIGNAAPARDLAVTSFNATQTAFEDAPVTMQAELLANGFAGREIRAALQLIGSDAPVAEQTLKPSGASEKLTVRFQVRPDRTGVLAYRLNVSAKGEENATEATPDNNSAIVSVDRGAEAQRVLYVSGRPNWEYKFLHRAVQGDSQTQLVGLIRIAKREPKFEFRGRAGESSNPLFRGFGNQSPEEIARYDQPVLLRLNAEDEHELRGGFPKTAEELFRYRAVIIDDLEAEFFTPDQMSLLQRFVSERGGSLLMLGGAESFAEGKYARTAIGEMLPVYLDGKSEEITSSGLVNWDLSRDGWLQPWARLRSTETDERKRLAGLPGFATVNSSGQPKPAASVVATVGDTNRQFPALVTQRFGRGRTAALLVGDLWHAGLGDDALRVDLEKKWRQLVRWLVADVPAQVQVTSEPQRTGNEVRLRVHARDRKFDPIDNATVTLTVHPIRPDGAAGAPVTLIADASSSAAGVYEASYVPREDGGYRVEATVVDENGAEAGRSQTGWSTHSAAAEFRSLAPDRALMEQLAAATGGRVLSPGELESFADGLPSRPAPLTETWSRPLWHTPLMFLLALGCLVGEWGVRRWKGLP